MDIALTISNRQISPGVVNLFQFENGTTTLNFTLDSYMYGEVNLRNYKAYAVTSINGSVDMTELVATYDASKDKLTLSWDVKEFTLLEAGAILYQIVFKEATASGLPEEGENTGVFYSYKGIIINRESIDGDNEISAKYPTILKQWLDRMNAMADLYDAGVVYMNYGETIAPADRLAGRLYFQYTDALNTKGQFEDDKGNILSDPDVVHNVGNETIAGTKTFTTSPKVPTPAANSNDTTVASTAFVNNAVGGVLKNTATGTDSLTLLGTKATQEKSTNVGVGAAAVGSKAAAFGYNANAYGGNATAIGANSSAVSGSTALGSEVSASNNFATAIGYKITASGQYSVAIGNDTTASDSYSMAIGYCANATASDAIQIGVGTNSTANTLQVATYTLLDMSTGKIPAERITGFLPLAGGTLTGKVTGTDLNLSGNIYGVSDDGRIIIGSGTSWSKGGHLALSGKGYSDNGGGFNLVATDGTTRREFIGKLDGGMSWNGIDISAMGMPSGVYKGLTLGSSGSTYTAPADGWLVLSKQSGGSGKYVHMYNPNTGIAGKVNSNASHGMIACLPVKKGDVITIDYTASGTTEFFRFIYAEGAKHLATE